MNNSLVGWAVVAAMAGGALYVIRKGGLRPVLAEDAKPEDVEEPEKKDGFDKFMEFLDVTERGVTATGEAVDEIVGIFV
jgi:hypothetical protein